LLPALLLMLGVSLLSLALPACSRKHRIMGPINQRPTVALTASATSGPSPLTVTFDAVADDPDGTITSWMWVFSDSGHVHGSVPQVQHTFVAQGDYIVTVRATDDHGAYAEASDTIRVGGTDQAPIVDAGIGQVNLDPGNTVFLFGSVTEPDGQPYTVLWTQQGGPTVTLSDPTVLNPVFTSIGSSSDTYTFRLSATDNGNPANTGSANVAVTTRVTWNNTARDIFAAHCTSCHYASNPSLIPSWQSYTETSAYLSSIRSKISVGGNMRGYLSTPTPASPPNVLIDWIDNGAPQSNP
jgi:PKD repeat protein